jgi:hypothetical protein
MFFTFDLKRVIPCITILIAVSFAQYQESLESKIRAAQNPLADRYFLGLQNNTGFGMGPESRANNILNFQPVYAFSFDSSLNITTRLVLPLSYEPDILNNEGGDLGLGDLNASLYLNMANSGPYMIGIGPNFVFPTATSNALGADKWAIGVSLIGEYNQENWLGGILIKNTWSYAGLGERRDINQLTLQPFVNFIIPKTNGLTITTAPTITADWELNNDRWTVPIGGGLGYLFRLGAWSTFLSVQAYGDVADSEDRPDWTLQTTAQVFFPK